MPAFPDLLPALIALQAGLQYFTQHFSIDIPSCHANCRPEKDTLHALSHA